MTKKRKFKGYKTEDRRRKNVLVSEGERSRSERICTTQRIKHHSTIVSMGLSFLFEVNNLFKLEKLLLFVRRFGDDGLEPDE